MFYFDLDFAPFETELCAALVKMLDAAAHLVTAALELERASPDDPKHPGWPAGAPDSQGGKFRPKDEDWVQVAGDVWVRPRRRQQETSGGKRDSALSEAAKRGVRLLIEAGLRAANIEAPGLGLMLEIGLNLAERAYPYISAYFDAPQTLDALQSAALDPQPGYDVHHVVEGATAQDASEAARINAPDNEVLIPTLKHWQLNGWYATKNDDFGDLSPRDYLKGKSWDERQRVGLMGLRIVGVLK
jgi:hypothetical protein